MPATTSGDAKRGAGGERDGARKLDPRIRRRQQARGDKGGDQRGRRNAVGHRSAHRDEAKQREQGQSEPAEPDQGEDRK